MIRTNKDSKFHVDIHSMKGLDNVQLPTTILILSSYYCIIRCVVLCCVVFTYLSPGLPTCVASA